MKAILQAGEHSQEGTGEMLSSSDTAGIQGDEGDSLVPRQAQESDLKRSAGGQLVVPAYLFSPHPLCRTPCPREHMTDVGRKYFYSLFHGFLCVSVGNCRRERDAGPGL